MELTDIISLEKWMELEKKINYKTGLDVNVFNIAGIRITEFKQWANKLCPAIKDTDKGQSFICAVAHMNLAAIARDTKKSVIEECDAGLIKIVVPIFVNQEYLGALGACGLLMDDGEVDSFLINKIAEIQEDKIEKLSIGIKTLSKEKQQEFAGFIEQQLDIILSGL